MLNLNPRPKFVTFDCYGTLVQWHSALQNSVRTILADKAGTCVVNESRVTDTVEALRTLSMEQQQLPPYRDYKTILQSSLSWVMARERLSMGADDGEKLLSSLRIIPPHPEVPAVLERLRTRYRLAIISNTDDDLISGTVAALGVPIDFVITAQQAGAYKPNHQLFRYAHHVLGATSQETVHVGMGQVTDLKVCDELGIQAVWINRSGETLNLKWTPAAVLPDLTILPNLLM